MFFIYYVSIISFFLNPQWTEFHKFWLGQDVPLLLIRYEDLIRHPDEVMARVVRFVLDIKNMASFFNERIDRCIREEQLEKLGSYKPRSGGIGKSLSKYSSKLLEKVDIEVYEIMAKMGYPPDFLDPFNDLARMKPLPHYGVQWSASYEWPPKEGEEVPHIVMNNGKLVRDAKHDTDWRAVKKSLGLVSNEKCMCYKCIAAAKQTST